MHKSSTLICLVLGLLFSLSCKKDKHSQEKAPFGVAVLLENDGQSEIWYMAKDGTSFNKVFNEDLGLTDICGNPAWSSDGRKIFFVRNSELTGINGIYRVKPDGTDFTPVYVDTEDQKRKFHHLVTSNDDQHIVFSYEIPRNGRTAIELYRMCPCGKRVERLTTFEIDKTRPDTYLNTEAYAGSFSDDHSTLLLSQADPTVNGKKDVRILSLNINDPENVRTIATISAEDVEGATPSLSPDGKTILLSIDSYIYSMNANGTKLAPVGQLRGYRPTWDVNNRDFYFSSYSVPDMQSGIYKSNLQVSSVEMISRNTSVGKYCGFSINY